MTLIELLLAISLFSALMGAVASLLLTGMRSQATWGAGLARYQAVEHALGRLADDVESAQPLFSLPFMGAAQQLELARTGHELDGSGAAASAWTRVVYRFEAEEDGLQLVREEFSADGGEPLRRERLMRATQGSFAFRVLNPQEEPGWVSSWDGASHGIPRLVKMNYAFSIGAAQPPVELSRVMRNPAGNLPTIERP